MLTIRAMSNGAGYAGEYLVQPDYHSEKGRITGQWFGKGAEMLGLTGEVKLEDFEAVREQLHPKTGEELRPRVSADRIGEDGKVQSHGRNLYDGTVSAPKSVSVMAIAGGDDRLREAHREAVAEMLQEAEAIAAARVRTDGANHDRTTGNVVMACYEHDTSRELDPQLHTHCVAANLTYDCVEKRWKALQATPFYQQRSFLTEVYRNALARNICALGYEIESRTDEQGRNLGFEIKGLSPELLRKFSQRSVQRDTAIEEYKLSHNGAEPTNNQITSLVQKTRQDKPEISAAEVRQQQQARLSESDREELRTIRERADRSLQSLQQDSPASSLGHSLDSLHYALDHVFERVSVASEHEILEVALKHGRGRVSMDDLRNCSKVMQESGDILRNGAEMATRESLEREKDMIRLVNEGIGTHERLGGKRTHEASSKLSIEQNEAVQFVLDSRDFAVSVQGAAGTGKTAMLNELRRELAHGGVLTTEVAPTQSAVEELQKVGFEGAMTIERLLQDKEAQSWLRGRALIIDEAGMVSGRQMHELLKLATEKNARIIFSGDTSQIQPVEACDALRVLESESTLKTISLSEVRRQQAKAYREAIETLRDDPAAGLKQLSKMDAVHLTTPEERPNAVAAAYATFAANPETKGSVLVVCPTHDEIGRVTKKIREEQRAAGNLGEEKTVERLEPLNWTEAQKRAAKEFAPGQVLVFHKETKDAQRNQAFEVVDVQDGKITAKDEHGRTVEFSGRHAKAYSVFEKQQIEVAAGDKLLLQQNRRGDLHTTNGEQVVVSRVDSDGFIHLQDGRTLPRDYQQFDYGYAITAHRSQGKSVDHVIVSGAAMSKELFYVAASRGKQSIQVFTSDQEVFEQSIARSAARQSATELAAQMAAWQVSQQQQQAHQATNAAQQHTSRTGPSVNAPTPGQAQSQSQSEGMSHDR